jgi:hypothetical protein
MQFEMLTVGFPSDQDRGSAGQSARSNHCVARRELRVQTGGSRPHPKQRGVVNDALALYFADVTIAGAFVARWCMPQRGEVAGGVHRRPGADAQ